MMKFIKKHPILTILVLLPFVGYIYLYFTDFRYDEDRHDWRHYLLPPLTEKWSKTIEYKALPHVKYRKYFMLSVNPERLYDNVRNKFGVQYDEVYDHKYSGYHLDDINKEQFYEEAKEKPRLLIKIYKDDVLLETLQLYFSQIRSGSDIEFNNRKMRVVHMMGRLGYKRGWYAYLFSENTNYRIEIINDTIVPSEFKDVETFFTFGTIEPKI